MATVRIKVSPPPEKRFRGESDTHSVIELSRVPCAGEIIRLQGDEKGSSADYRVVLVHHAPTGSGALDAEVYARRVTTNDLVRELGLVWWDD